MERESQFFGSGLSCKFSLLNEEIKLHKCHEDILNKIISIIKSIDIMELIDKKSKSLKPIIEIELSKLHGLNWNKSPVIPIKDFANISMPGAIFQLDGVFKCDLSCEESRLINFVICLNNREAIGGNLLKLEVANRHFRNEFGIGNLGVLVALHEELLDFGGWDSSYASSHQYVEAYSKVFKDFFTSHIGVLEIGIV